MTDSAASNLPDLKDLKLHSEALTGSLGYHSGGQRGEVEAFCVSESPKATVSDSTSELVALSERLQRYSGELADATLAHNRPSDALVYMLPCTLPSSQPTESLAEVTAPATETRGPALPSHLRIAQEAIKPTDDYQTPKLLILSDPESHVVPASVADTVNGPADNSPTSVCDFADSRAEPSVIPSSIPEVVSASFGDHPVVPSIRETVRTQAVHERVSPSVLGSVPDSFSVNDSISVIPFSMRGPKRPRLRVTEAIESRPRWPQNQVQVIAPTALHIVCQLERVRRIFPTFRFPLPCVPNAVSAWDSASPSVPPVLSDVHETVRTPVPSSVSVPPSIPRFSSVHLSGPERPQLQVNQAIGSRPRWPQHHIIAPTSLHIVRQLERVRRIVPIVPISVPKSSCVSFSVPDPERPHSALRVSNTPNALRGLPRRPQSSFIILISVHTCQGVRHVFPSYSRPPLTPPTRFANPSDGSRSEIISGDSKLTNTRRVAALRLRSRPRKPLIHPASRPRVAPASFPWDHKSATMAPTRLKVGYDGRKLVLASPSGAIGPDGREVVVVAPSGPSEPLCDLVLASPSGAPPHAFWLCGGGTRIAAVSVPERRSPACVLALWRRDTHSSVFALFLALAAMRPEVGPDGREVVVVAPSGPSELLCDLRRVRAVPSPRDAQALWRRDTHSGMFALFIACETLRLCDDGTHRVYEPKRWVTQLPSSCAAPSGPNQRCEFPMRQKSATMAAKSFCFPQHPPSYPIQRLHQRPDVFQPSFQPPFTPPARFANPSGGPRREEPSEEKPTNPRRLAALRLRFRPRKPSDSDQARLPAQRTQASLQGVNEPEPPEHAGCSPMQGPDMAISSSREVKTLFRKLSPLPVRRPQETRDSQTFSGEENRAPVIGTIFALDDVGSTIFLLSRTTTSPELSAPRVLPDRIMFDHGELRALSPTQSPLCSLRSAPRFDSSVCATHSRDDAHDGARPTLLRAKNRHRQHAASKTMGEQGQWRRRRRRAAIGSRCVNYSTRDSVRNGSTSVQGSGSTSTAATTGASVGSTSAAQQGNDIMPAFRRKPFGPRSTTTTVTPRKSSTRLQRFSSSNVHKANCKFDNSDSASAARIFAACTGVQNSSSFAGIAQYPASQKLEGDDSVPEFQQRASATSATACKADAIRLKTCSSTRTGAHHADIGSSRKASDKAQVPMTASLSARMPAGSPKIGDGPRWFSQRLQSPQLQVRCGRAAFVEDQSPGWRTKTTASAGTVGQRKHHADISGLRKAPTQPQALTRASSRLYSDTFKCRPDCECAIVARWLIRRTRTPDDSTHWQRHESRGGYRKSSDSVTRTSAAHAKVPNSSRRRSRGFQVARRHAQQVRRCIRRRTPPDEVPRHKYTGSSTAIAWPSVTRLGNKGNPVCKLTRYNPSGNALSECDSAQDASPTTQRSLKCTRSGDSPCARTDS
ncbi:hypothetical protein EDB84DRAFT_1679508 [Lactarius hengduanensis]|nr:hypothetical protein EDB84DRAFT_1679508 [Lactarius hengduanensis]